MNKENKPFDKHQNNNGFIVGAGEHFLGYEEWFAKFEDDINIELAETGADREMDFDRECEFDKRYEMYLNA